MKQITITIPDEAIEPLTNLINILCNYNCDLNSDSNFIKSEPLPNNIRNGVLLRAARLRADLTQKELANKINVPQTHISQYEKNKRKIPLQKARELAAILNTSEDYFI